MRRLLTLAALLLPGTLAAQHGPEFSLGLGGGAMRINCDNCEEATWSGSGAMMINAMFPLDKRVMLGGGLVFTQAGSGPNETNVRGLSVELRWAPNLHKGFTARAGYGLAIANSELTDSTGVKYTNDLTGMLLSVGVGWRFPLSQRVGLEAGVRGWTIPWGSVRPNDAPFFQNVLSSNYAALVTISWR